MDGVGHPGEQTATGSAVLRNVADQFGGGAYIPWGEFRSVGVDRGAPGPDDNVEEDVYAGGSYDELGTDFACTRDGCVY